MDRLIPTRRLLAGLALWACIATARADLVYVDQDAAGGNLGTTWSDAYSSLAEVLSTPGVVRAGDEIWVARGTYRPGDAGTPEASFELIAGVALYGGFVGNEASRDQRDPSVNITTLSGAYDLGGNATAHAWHVVTGENVGPDTILDGFTIIGGNAVFAGTGQGGGIRLDNANPMLVDCIIRDNESSIGGGGVALNNCPGVTFIGCTITGNHSEGFGGGLLTITSGTVTLIDTVVSNNTSIGQGAGASNLVSTTLLLERCRFENNIATGDGGGIANNPGCILNATNCVFSGNSGRTGGGIFVTSSQATIERCTFRANIGSSASAGGAGIQNVASDTIIRDCLFRENTTFGLGAAIANQNSSPLIEHCAFSDNWSLFGGAGIFNRSSSSPVIRHCHFRRNRTDERGGAIYSNGGNALIEHCTFEYNEGQFGGAVHYTSNADGTIHDCRFAGNESDFGGGVYILSSSPTVDACIFENNSAAFGGAIRVSRDSTARIVGSLFLNNRVSQLGGAMYNVADTTPRIERCIFIGNEATDATTVDGIFSPDSVQNCDNVGNQNLARGGAICNRDFARPVITECIFARNIAADGGAVCSVLNSSATIVSSRFIDNAACFGGGVFSSKSSETIMVNCVFDRNEATLGGGVHSRDNSAARLINCTMTNNIADEGGAVDTRFGSRLDLFNAIVWDNLVDQVAVDETSVQNVRAAIVRDGVAGEHILTENPQFIGNLGHIGPTSPAINAGFISLVPADTRDVDDDGDKCERIDHDIDGSPRMMMINAADGAPCAEIIDLGAYEREAPIIVTSIWGDITASGGISTDDFVAIFIAFGPCAGCCAADVNANGVVTIDDALLWSDQTADCTR
jgi:predicted outer membrane repeat protein